MANPTGTQAANAVVAASTLATAEKRLWAITEEQKFSSIPAEGKVMSGEELVTKALDPYFAETTFADIPKPITDLSFLKGADGAMKPEVAAFVQAHPDKVAGFVEYAQQYVTIGESAAALNTALTEAGVPAKKAQGAVDAIIGDVDKVAESGTKNVDATKIADTALDSVGIHYGKKDFVRAIEQAAIELGGKGIKADGKLTQEEATRIEKALEKEAMARGLPQGVAENWIDLNVDKKGQAAISGGAAVVALGAEGANHADAAGFQVQTDLPNNKPAAVKESGRS